ncbi:MAG: class I tRNA ligase family protein [Chloroflexota bacterium]
MWPALAASWKRRIGKRRLLSRPPADRWILARTQQVIARVTELFAAYDYATAKSEMEAFFWRDLADNYLEMAKKRLYDGGAEAVGAQMALSTQRC